MTAKQYLSQLRKLNLSIEQNRLELERLREDSRSIKATDYGSVAVSHSSGNEASYAAAVERLIDLEAKVSVRIAMLAALRNKIILEISEMSNPRFSDLLYQRYVEGRSLEQIAVKMAYSYSRVKHMHGIALQAFQKEVLDNADR